MNSLAPGCATAETSEVRLGARFIQKDQLGGVEARLLLAPETARPRDVWTALLTGAECLFLYVNPIFPNTTWIACKEHWSLMASRNSFSVRSFFLVNNERIWLRWVATIIGLRPQNRYRGAMSPVRRRCCRSFLTMPRDTRKRWAISGRVPSSLS
jgi:hypothetical protein